MNYTFLHRLLAILKCERVVKVNVNTNVNVNVKVNGVLQPVSVDWLRVRSEVQLRFAHTSVRASLSNPSSRAQEVQLSLALPDSGYVTGMSL